MSDDLRQIYIALKNKIDEYLSGKITAEQLKPSTAPFGIYQQRNDLFMVRVRITGGHISAETLRGIAALMNSNSVPYAHLSSRQDIQLHDAAGDKIFDIVLGSDKIGLPFKGGGGNTYRNILVSPNSGFAPGEAFDVLPYAHSLNIILRAYDNAFALPRKLKIGFFSDTSEEFNAALQDLGFLAVTENGKRGFKVYGGGGMGRESALGVKLFDFLPAEEYVRCALAMTELFNDNGDRNNRNKARIRFIIQSIGQEAFVKLFQKYFAKTDLETLPNPQAISYNPPSDKVNAIKPAEHFDEWRAYAVSATNLENYFSVRLYVPYGNLNAVQLKKIADLADDLAAGIVRLTQTQDILLTHVHALALPVLHKKLLEDFQDADLTLKSFKGHILSCIGAGVCKIGILPAPETADTLAAYFDKELLHTDDEKKLEKLRLLTSQLRISGCPNSCSGHPAAKIGIQGQKQRIAEKLEPVGLIFTGAVDAPGKMAISTPCSSPLKIIDLPLKVDELLNKLSASGGPDK